MQPHQLENTKAIRTNYAHVKLISKRKPLESGWYGVFQYVNDEPGTYGVNFYCATKQRWLIPKIVQAWTNQGFKTEQSAKHCMSCLQPTKFTRK